MKRLKRPSWWLPERAATPEHVFRNRRALLAAGGGLVAAGAVGALATMGGMPPAVAAADADSTAQGARTAGSLPAPRSPFTPMPDLNPGFADAGRPVTDEGVNTTYNNFYEFGSHKQIHDAADALQTDGWTLQIDGLVEEERTIAVADLLARMPMEERVIRHRCVEAWSMVVPWIGFPMSALLAEAKPLGSAKYVQMQTFLDQGIARGQRQHWYPWPYTEGLTMAEAAHELSFMVVGAYGKVLHQPFGAPIRLHTPWKYGFKHIKSIVRLSFTEERPVSFWEELQASEYGFWANVNPAVSHPRWSQATERVLGTDERVPTEIFNGYGEAIEGLYAEAEIQEAGIRFWR
ncbi:MAG: protein-methionine-sulfoxide reductase catalytic subunit MsrP [Pseudomonadota bacterium]